MARRDYGVRDINKGLIYWLFMVFAGLLDNLVSCPAIRNKNVINKDKIRTKLLVL